MARGTFATILLCAAAMGCGQKGGAGGSGAPAKMDTPKNTAISVIQAFKDRNAAGAVALLPPEDAIKKTFDCAGDELVKRIASRRESIPKEIAKIEKDVQVDIGEFDKEGTEEKVLRVGEEYDGCKIKTPVTVHKSRLELKLTKNGKVDFDEETWRFFKFGEEEKWYFFD